MSIPERRELSERRERRERREQRACPPKRAARRRERRTWGQALLVAAFAVSGATAIWATCGGGGGGGTGGMSGGSAASPEVYPVPWKMAQDSTIDPNGLMIYWFPLSQNELEKSSLRNSRTLSLYASQCVALGVADGKSTFGQKYVADETLPVAVLTRGDGSVIGKAVHKDGFLRVAQVEKLLETEVKQERGQPEGNAEDRESTGKGGQGRRDREVQGSDRQEVHVPEGGQGRGKRVEETRRHGRRAVLPGACVRRRQERAHRSDDEARPGAGKRGEIPGGRQERTNRRERWIRRTRRRCAISASCIAITSATGTGQPPSSTSFW